MLLDRVDNLDVVVGSIDRKEVFLEKANFRVVHLLLFNDKQELLIQQLSDEHQVHAGWWGSSVAGFVLAGETYDQAIQRRTEHELSIKNVNIIYLGKTNSVEQVNCTKFISVYYCNYNGPILPNPKHIATVEFVSLEKLSESVNRGERKFTPTFLHVLDFYLATKNNESNNH